MMTTTLQVKDKGVHIMVQGGTYLYNKIPEGAYKKKLTDTAVYAKNKGAEYAGAAVEMGKQTAVYAGKKGYDIGKGVYNKVKDNEKVMSIGGTVYNHAKTVTGAVGSYIASKTGGASASAEPAPATDSSEPAVVPNPDMTKDVKDDKKEEKKEDKKEES